LVPTSWGGLEEGTASAAGGIALGLDLPASSVGSPAVMAATTA
jgi:hypothetical protein